MTHIFNSGDCLLTDLPEMVPLMKKNVAKNSPFLEGKANVKPFEWGTEISSLVPHSDQGFQIVLAADCIYYKEVYSFVPLLFKLGKCNILKLCSR